MSKRITIDNDEQVTVFWGCEECPYRDEQTGICQELDRKVPAEVFDEACLYPNY